MVEYAQIINTLIFYVLLAFLALFGAIGIYFVWMGLSRLDRKYNSSICRFGFFMVNIVFLCGYDAPIYDLGGMVLINVVILIYVAIAILSSTIFILYNLICDIIRGIRAIIEARKLFKRNDIIYINR
jgi:hypothetical protein